MMHRAQIRLLPDGHRLHLQDGPIDLIVAAFGSPHAIALAYRGATQRFIGLLDELCNELPALRAQAGPCAPVLRGAIARRMARAVTPFAAGQFITPMAAVAGAVAQEILGAMTDAAPLERAYVNNGGDIALHLSQASQFSVGMIDRPDRPFLIGRTIVTGRDPVRGIATSGRHGRSFSRGIADAVTVLAQTAAQADAAATVIANAVDLPDHTGIVRQSARDIQPDNDLGDLLVTRAVPELSDRDVMRALDAGAICARKLLARGLIVKASLHLRGVTQTVAEPAIVQIAEPARERLAYA